MVWGAMTCVVVRVFGSPTERYWVQSLKHIICMFCVLVNPIFVFLFVRQHVLLFTFCKSVGGCHVLFCLFWIAMCF